MCSLLIVDGASEPAESTDIVIRLAIHQAEPLTGIAEAACPCSPVPFAGWLELLRAISDLVAASRCVCGHGPIAALRLPQTEGDPDLS